MAAAALKATVPPTWEMIKLCLGFICTRGDYFCELEDNLGTLRNENVRLMDLVEHILSRVRRENGQQMQKTHQVNDWLSRVDVFQSEVVQVMVDAEEEIQHKCIRFCCPKNGCSCSRVGIRVSNKILNVRELLTDGNFSDVVERIPGSHNRWVAAITDVVLYTTRRVIRVVGLPATEVQG